MNLSVKPGIVSMMASILRRISTTCHWFGNLSEWIADSWSPSSDDGDEAIEELPQLPFAGTSDDDDFTIEAANREQLIREIVKACVEQGTSAETLRVNMLGLCRSLGAMSQMIVEQSNHKGLCMEAAGVLAVTASCEQMLKSVSGFNLIRSYRFSGED